VEGTHARLRRGLRVPWGVSEVRLRRLWLKEPVKVMPGPTTELPYPADAEIVLEGEIGASEVETKMEGPFSEWTGHYSPPGQRQPSK